MELTFLWGIILFGFGLIAGSFLNVVICRYDPEKFLFDQHNLGGRSHCPHCQKNLSWYELIPLFSFLLQLGRCRNCHKKISWQYPIVELLSGLIFLLPLYFYYYFQIPQQLLLGQSVSWYYWFAIAWVLASLLMLLLSIIDWHLYLIPDEAVIGLGLTGLFLAAWKYHYQSFFNWKISFLENYAAVVSLPTNVFWNHLLAGLIGVAFFGLIFTLTQGRGMGFGDVKLAGALGLLMGWPDIVLAYGFSFVIGSLVGACLLIFGRKKFREPIPFGPYLIIGVFLTIFFGHQVLDWYFRLFGIF